MSDLGVAGFQGVKWNLRLEEGAGAVGEFYRKLRNRPHINICISMGG